jgi:HEAT repeat protein
MLLFIVILAGIAGAFWLAVRHFPRPELQPSENVKEEPSTEGAASAAVNGDADLRDRIRRLGELIARDDKRAVHQLATEIAHDYRYENLMQLFLPRKKDGLGVGLTPGAIKPDGIEAMLHAMQKQVPPDLDLESLRTMGYQLVAIAEVLNAIGAPSRSPEPGPSTHAAHFLKATRDLARVAKDDDVFKFSEAAERVNQKCLACHEHYGGAPLVHTLKTSMSQKETNNLMDIATGVGKLNERLVALELLGTRKDEAPHCVPMLIGVLKKPELKLQETALAALRNLGQKDSTGRPALDACLKEDTPYLRFWFAHRMEKAKSVSAELAGALKDPDRDVRAKAAEMLGHLPDEAAAIAPVLKAALENDKDEEVRWAATRALSRFKTDDAVAPLLTALKDSDPIVRGRAAQGLAKLGKPAVPGIRGVLKDGDRDVKASALGALGRIGADAREAVPDLQTLLKGEDALLQKLAGDAIRKIDAKAAAEAGLQ